MLSPPSFDTRLMVELKARLQAHGYSDPGCRRILGLAGLREIQADRLPGLLNRCRQEGSPLARLTAFWLLREPLDREELDSLLGADIVQALGQLKLLEVEDGRARGRAGLYPCLDDYFFADPLLGCEALDAESPTGLPWLADWGYALALCTPRQGGQRSLDLGPGVQALLNASNCARSWGTCASDRARETCQINLCLNGLEERCHFDPVDSEDFDLITGGLPWLPPSTELEHPLIRGLCGRLREGGTMVLAVGYFGSDEPLLQRVERWVGTGGGWGLGQYDYSIRALGAEPILTPDITEDRLIDHLGATTLEGKFQFFSRSLLFFRRLPAGRPGWRRRVSLPAPREVNWDLWARWLEAQDRFREEDWQNGEGDWQDSWVPRWSYTDRLYLDPRSGLGMVKYQRERFGKAVALDPESAFLLQDVDGQKTAGQLLASYAWRWQQTADEARPEVARRLADLCRQVMIE